MSLAALLLRGRAKAEALMVDACTIRRVLPNATITDPLTGDVTHQYDIVYQGICRVQTQGNWGERRDVAQDNLVLLTLQVQLPMTATGLRSNDEITVDASVFDPDLVGRVMRVRDLHHKTHATSRRLMCTEITG